MAKTIIGWNELCHFPELQLNHIEAKIDTGAKTSCLHAFDVTPFEQNESSWVRFNIHPERGNNNDSVVCIAKVMDQREVRDSGGHIDMRYVIQTNLVVGNGTQAKQHHNVEFTLTNRDAMAYRMLLGRNVLQQDYLVDVRQAFLLGLPND